MATELQCAPVTEVLRRHGVVGALKYLNDRVPHRLTAIYRLVEADVICVYLYDKQGELTTDLMVAVPLGDSFCQFAMRDGLFLTDNTVVDSRLNGNPNQGVVVCYHGLPVLDEHSELYGTLCHFDFVPLELPDGEFEFLQHAATCFGEFLRK